MKNLRYIGIAGFVLIFLTFAGCTKSCSNKDKAGSGQGQEVKDERPSYAGITVKRVVQRELSAGTGAVVQDGSTISYKQTTWIYDTKKPANHGKQISGGQDKVEQATLGTGNVIRGIEQGVLGMKKGGKRQLIIPPEHAYGDKGMAPDVFPGAILLVDIEIVDVK